MSVKLYLHHRPTADGSKVVYLYAHLKNWRSPFRRSVGVSVDPARWDESGQQMKGRGEEARKLNILLHDKRAVAQEIIRDWELMRRPLSRAQFIQEYENPTLRQDFITFFEKKMGMNYERRLIGKGALLTEKRTLRRLKERHPDGLMFSEVNRDWLEEWDAWLAKVQASAGNDGRTERRRALILIRKYLNDARRTYEGRYQITDPFVAFRMPRTDSNPDYLESEELEELIGWYNDPDGLLAAMVRDAERREMFEWNIPQFASVYGRDRLRRVLRHLLWQCHTGMRYSDTLNFERAWIQENHIWFMPYKTRNTSGKTVKLWITPMMQRLIEAGEGEGERVFSCLTNQKYNLYLKELGRVIQFEKELHTHMGRHTFATESLRRGIHIETLKELMGLRKIETLMKYVHVSETRMDEEMRDAWGD